MKKLFFLLFLLPFFSCTSNTDKKLDKILAENDSIKKMLVAVKDSVKETKKPFSKSISYNWSGSYGLYNSMVDNVLSITLGSDLYTGYLECSGKQTYYKFSVYCDPVNDYVLKVYFKDLIEGGKIGSTFNKGDLLFKLVRNGKQFAPYPSDVVFYVDSLSGEDINFKKL